MKEFNNEQFKSAVNLWVENELTEYIHQIEQDSHPVNGKDLNDSIWGTISLTAIECLLIDSPIFQRLRRIKQLGCVHWVYPGASHSRFEHTLGVLHNSQILMDSILKSAKSIAPEGIPLTPEWQQSVRLAALCHDLGHMTFSHVSEKVLHSLPDFMNLRQELSLEFGVDHKTISELISAQIVKSPTFNRLLETIFSRTDQNIPKNPHLQDILVSLILGKTIYPNIPLLHEIVTGPFDADKLDYITRDSIYTGVSISIDITRLLQKVTVIKEKTENLPLGFQSLNLENEYSWIFGIKSSGNNTIDELHLARAFLFSKVYKHKKTLAIEGMIANTLRSLKQIFGNKGLLNILITMSDEQLLSLYQYDPKTTFKILNTQACFNKRIAFTANEKYLDKFFIGCKNLQERRFFVRCFCFKFNYFDEDVSPNMHNSYALARGKLTEPDSLSKIKYDIITIAANLLLLLGDERNIEDIKFDLDYDIWISSPSENKNVSSIDNSIIISDDGKYTLARDDGNLNTGRWIEAYQSISSDSFIYTSTKYREIIYLCTYVYLCTEYKLRIPAASRFLSKINKKSIDDLIERATDKGFFNKYPIYAKPEHNHLELPVVKRKIQDLKLKFAKLELYNSENQCDFGDFNNNIAIYINSMPNIKMIEHFLIILQALQIIDRKDASQAITEFFKTRSEYKDKLCTITLLGELKDSTSFMGYLAQDNPELIKGSLTIKQALDKDDNQIIFFDDFASSGRQCVSILERWLDIQKPQYDLGEKREKLSSKYQKKLRDRKLVFIFIVLSDEAENLINTFLKEHKIDADVYGYINQKDIPTVQNSLKKEGKSQNDINEFESFLNNRAALSVEARDKPDRRLGYGNLGLLMATTYNIPAQTITYLWADKIIKDDLTEPALIPRRRKK